MTVIDFQKEKKRRAPMQDGGVAEIEVAIFSDGYTSLWVSGDIENREQMRWAIECMEGAIRAMRKHAEERGLNA